MLMLSFCFIFIIDTHFSEQDRTAFLNSSYLSTTPLGLAGGDQMAVMESGPSTARGGGATPVATDSAVVAGTGGLLRHP